jgi:hypothetical protein
MPSVFPIAEWANANLPKDARILVVGDAQVLYYKRPVYANSVFDEQFFAAAARDEKDSEGILKRLQKRGITYVVFDKLLGVMNAREYRQYELNGDEWNKIDDFAQRGLVPIVDQNAVALYQVKENLVKKESRVPNPFYLYPPQALDFLCDLKDGNYSKARRELDELKAFFPGDDHWAKKEVELVKMVKMK